MNSVFILLNYIRWHYTKTPKEIVYLNIEFTNFILNLFSVPSLLKRLMFIWLDITKKVLKRKDTVGIISDLFLYSFLGALEAVLIIFIISIAVILILIFALISVLSLGAWFFIPAAIIIMSILIINAIIF